MPWFYNSYSGELSHASGLNSFAYEAILHTGTGWHELKIPDSATEAQAAAEAVKENPKGAKPTTSIAGGAGNLGNAATGGISGDVKDFLGIFTQGNTWMRVGEGLLGIVLIAVGVAGLRTGREQTVLSALNTLTTPYKGKH